MKLTLDTMRMQKGEECGAFCNKKDDDEHPNASPFKGILLVVDEASTRPPNGAEGHRIYVPKSVAKSRLSSLISMGLNYFNSLDRHNPQQKVGVIERAWIKGKNVWCSGVIWTKDFPGAVNRLRTAEMGMSMELADVLVEDKDSDVWKLIDFDFTGATALKKQAAAYERTTLAASACEKTEQGEHAAMKKTSNSRSSGNSDLAKLIANAVQTGVAKGVTLAMKPVTDSLEELTASVSTQNETIGALAAATLNARKDDDDDDAAAAMMKDDDDAAASKDDDDDDDADAAADVAARGKKKGTDTDEGDGGESSSESDEDDDDDDELSAELQKLSKDEKNSLATDESGDDDPEPGELNRNAKNRGDKKVVSASRSFRKVHQIAAAAIETAQKVRKNQTKLVKNLRASKDRIRELEETVEEMQAQNDEFSTAIHRRSLPANMTMLLEKAGHSINDIYASGEKLPVATVDEIIRTAKESGVQMTTLDSMTFKTKLVEAGLMD